MTKVTLYKWTNYNALPANKIGFSLTGTRSFDFVGDVDELEFTLPEGFELAESNMGTLEFYDPNGKDCTLTNQGNSPFLVTSSGRSFALGK